MAVVNYVRPPFTGVLEDFKWILQKYFGLRIKDIKQTQRSLRFRLHGIDFDLLPATNMNMTTIQDQGKECHNTVREEALYLTMLSAVTPTL